MELGRRLREILAQRDISQREFGKLLGLNEATISNYVNSARLPSLVVLQAMADRLGVTADYLLCRTDDPKGYTQADFPDDWDSTIQILKDANLSPADIEQAVGVLKELKKMREGN